MIKTRLLISMSTAERCTTRALLLLFILFFLLSPSSAGGQRGLLQSNVVVQGEPKIEVTTTTSDDEDTGEVKSHGRVLRVHVPADDYARFDPSPTMNKPHFKDIPN